jgi:hypothetical protein
MADEEFTNMADINSLEEFRAAAGDPTLTEEMFQQAKSSANPLNGKPVHERAQAIAFVVDDEVVDIIYTDDRLAAMFMSDPTVVDITHLVSDPLLHPAVGWAYDADTNTFIGRDGDGEPVSIPV